MPLIIPPEEIDACELVTDQLPPDAASVSVIKPPAQMDEPPEIAPAFGAAFTVIVVVPLVEPQLFVRV